jgi:hypothetical protein
MVSVQSQSVLAGPITMNGPAGPPGKIIFGAARHLFSSTEVLVDDVNPATWSQALGSFPDNGHTRAFAIKESYNNPAPADGSEAQVLGNIVSFTDVGRRGMNLKITDSAGAKDKLVLEHARRAVIAFKGGPNAFPGVKYEGAVELVDVNKVYSFSITAEENDSMFDVMQRARTELLSQMLDDSEAPGVLLERGPPPSLVFIFGDHGFEWGVSSSTRDTEPGGTIGLQSSYAEISSIPEPQTIVLSGIGLAGLLIARRRRLNKGAQSAA